MKIAYIVPENISIHSGLNYKINSQVSEWAKEDNDVFLVKLAERTVTDYKGNIIYMEHIKESPFPSRIGVFHDNHNSYKFALTALKIIKPNLTYSRYLFPSFNTNQIKKHSKTLIVEINADDVSEYNQKNVITGMFNRIFRSRFLVTVDGFIFVTNEIRKSNNFKFNNKSSIVIANGVDTKDFDFIETTNNDVPNLVFVGSPNQSWHGIDKIEQLAKILPDSIIHIIGPSKLECESQWSMSPKNVIFHGYLTNHKTNIIVKNSDIGIGTLSLYRKGMNEACPLKVRQYLAFGIPVIAAYQDTDLSDKEEFFLKLPNNNNELNDYKEDIINFVNKAFNNKNLRLNARNFATMNLCNKKKELIRLNFFMKLSNEK